MLLNNMITILSNEFVSPSEICMFVVFSCASSQLKEVQMLVCNFLEGMGVKFGTESSFYANKAILLAILM